MTRVGVASGFVQASPGMLVQFAVFGLITSAMVLVALGQLVFGGYPREPLGTLLVLRLIRCPIRKADVYAWVT